MTAKLKFKLALKVAVDPVTILGIGFIAGLDQAGNTPDYQQGAKGYGQRFGAIAADGTTDILFGGAVLPSLLHQDPRYFYQGKGTTRSRFFHAVTYPFVCRGDNGQTQPNYSSLGGDWRHEPLRTRTTRNPIVERDSGCSGISLWIPPNAQSAAWPRNSCSADLQRRSPQD